MWDMGFPAGEAPSVTQTANSLTFAQFFNPGPLVVGDRHHREARHADERERGEGFVSFDLRERDRRGELLHRFEVERVQRARLVGRIRIRVANHLRDADDRLLPARVIEEDAVPLLDRPQMLLRERIADRRGGFPSRTRSSKLKFSGSSFTSHCMRVSRTDRGSLRQLPQFINLRSPGCCSCNHEAPAEIAESRGTQRPAG